jgi:tetratricopeptide (TPR) repeat protein
MTRASASWVVIGSVALWPLATGSFAQTSDQAEQSSALVAAQIEHRAAVHAFALGDYREAIALFSAADEQLPNAAYSFNIAKAYEALGDASRAIRFYRDYLRRAGNPPDTRQVNERIQALDAGLATQGAKHVARSSAPSATPAALARPPTALAPVTPASDLAPRSVALRTPEPAPGSGLRTAGFVTLAAGVAAFGGGLIFEIMRAHTENSAKHENEQTRFAAQLDTMRSQQTAARVFAGTGIALATAGGALLTAGFLASKPDASERLAFACRPSACQASFAGVF